MPCGGAGLAAAFVDLSGLVRNLIKISKLYLLVKDIRDLMGIFTLGPGMREQAACCCPGSAGWG
ncbi:MAG: hypothetical protein AMK70_12890 [Nitrospira bacterium SG8_35_1]|nr:MAG: hypothetical protein AMK70_12890 [Nitrospira bacterium SG8_35_1]